MRLFFQENEWALSTSWSGKPLDFFPPKFTNVSNLGHPLFSRIAVPHVVLNFHASAEKKVYRVPIDAAHFHCAAIDYVSNGNRTTIEVWPPPGVTKEKAGDPPGRLSGGLSKTIYGHTARNDLSLWGSEYIRILYDLRDPDLRKRLNGGKDGAYHLRIELLFQFGPYSSEPSHEPSGMLNSARLIPAISFDTVSPHLRRLRFDMQCEPRLESLDLRIKDVAFPAIALLTRDAEMLDPLGASRGVGAAAFAKIEKPLVYEICSTGWRAGSSGRSGSAAVAGEGTPLWDNVHIAPGKCDGKSWVPELPSAPGAYYSLHCHWRWGKMLGDFWFFYNNSAWWKALKAAQPKSKLLYLAFMDRFFHTLHPDGRDAQYQGLEITAKSGGPLFDPNLPVQTVQLLIAKSAHAKLPKDPKFELVHDFLAGQKGDPEFINGGETLSWWLSFAVENSRPADGSVGLKPFGGTLFTFGTHFAHNLYEPTGFISGVFGPDGALSAPTKGEAAYDPERAPKAWVR